MVGLLFQIRVKNDIDNAANLYTVDTVVSGDMTSTEAILVLISTPTIRRENSPHWRCHKEQKR